MHNMKRFLKLFTQVEEKVSLLVYIVMLTITFINVIGRYVFHASISFTDEVTTNLFVLLSIIGTGIAARGRAHLGLSAFTELLSQKTQLLISAIGNALGCMFGLILLITGIGMTMNQIRLGTITAMLLWPAWIFGIFLPIGAVFITVRFLQVTIEDFKSFASYKAEGGTDK